MGSTDTQTRMATATLTGIPRMTHFQAMSTDAQIPLHGVAMARFGRHPWYRTT